MEENRFEKIETDMAYLQDTVGQLNEIVTAQAVLIEKLEKSVVELAKRVQDLDPESRPNRKPPHY